MDDPDQMAADEKRRELGRQWVVRARRDGQGLELVPDAVGIDPVPFDPSPAGDADIQTWTDAQLIRLSRVAKLSPELPAYVRRQEIWKSLAVRRQAGMIIELGRVPGLHVSENTVTDVTGALRRVVSATWRARSRIQWIADAPIGLAYVMAPLSAVSLGVWWFGTALTSWLWLVFGALCVGTPVLALLLIYFYASTFDDLRYAPPWRAFVYVTACVTAVAIAAYAALRQRGEDPSLLIQAVVELVLSTLIFFTIAGLAIAASSYLQDRVSRRVPVDTLVHDLVALAWLAWSSRGRPPSRWLLHEIEATAQRTERNFRSLGPRQDRTLRPWSADLVRRLAEAIRRHKISLVHPGGSPHTVAQSLINGVEAVLAGNLDALTRYEPPPIGRTLVRRFAPRVALAAALFAAGFGTELVAEGTAAADLKRLLWLAASTALITPDVKKAADAVLLKRMDGSAR